MTTLLRAAGRRCDATCHEAHERACRCICQGALHGRREDAIRLRDLLNLERLGDGVRAADVQAKLFSESHAKSLQAPPTVPTM